MKEGGGGLGIFKKYLWMAPYFKDRRSDAYHATKKEGIISELIIHDNIYFSSFSISSGVMMNVCRMCGSQIQNTTSC